MVGTKVQVLFIEDNEPDFVLTNQLIDREVVDVAWVTTLAEAATKLSKNKYDAILLYLSLPDSHGIDTLDRVIEPLSDYPSVVILTGSDDEYIASEALKRGAQDYIVKGQISSSALMKSILYSIKRNQADTQMRKTNDQLVAMNSQLVLARDAAMEMAKVRTDFLADLSHEIRTPMSGIVSLAELLILEPDLSANVKELAETIYSSALRTVSTLNSLLDLSKLESGKMVANVEPTSVRLIVSDVVATIKPTADRKRVEILANVADNVPEQIDTDPVRFKQIVLNFAHNAVKFTAKGRVTIETVLAEKDDLPYLHISVNDTGIGIAPAAHSKLFEAFVQADSVTYKQYGGTGLGLAISKRSVELLRGEIGFDSQEGKGSTFWFKIPTAPLRTA